jgi:hypothetical protein
MKRIFNIKFFTLLSLFYIGCSTNKENASLNDVTLVKNEALQKVDILVNDTLFTSFLYTEKIPDLTKPVLYPVISADGSIITRGFPLEPRPAERTDHPHHSGMWLTYGDVNHIDFWGNSTAIPRDQWDRMGWIKNTKIGDITSGKGKGSLNVSMDWKDSENRTLLKEKTHFVFRAGGNYRIIDRVTTLTAQKDTVIFYDTKEGMMGIRVNRALELPSEKPVVLSDKHGNKTEVAKMDNTGVTGNYLNSNGVEGLDVWGKRADWVSLYGKIDDKDVAVVIFDYPDNPGHPSYWHARGYGLFAVNPLGQKTFSKGKEELNLSLNPGESVTFRYRVLIWSGTINKTKIDKFYQNYMDE